ncbi:MAG: AsmA family protein [Steroidobacteraceae bacterium]
MRALKIIGIIIGCIVALLIAAVIALWLTVNPNDYKGRIEAAVRSSTGRDLSFTGNIHLAIFPSIALELGPASLGNPPGFTSSQPFASLKRVSLRVHVLPLLHHRLEVGRIEIDGLDLRLLKTPQGKGNWAMPAAKTAASTSQPSAGSEVALGGIGGVVIKNSRVSYQDSATAANLSDLDARIDGSALRGNAAVTNLTTGAVNFDLSMDHIDLDRYLGATPKTSPAIKPPPPAPPAAANAPPTELPTSALKTLQLNGKLAIGSATIHGVKLSQIEVGLNADEGVLHIAPARAELYGGTSTGTVTLDAHGAVPVLHLDENLAGIAVQPLLVDFAKFNRVSGRGDVKMNVTATGNTTAAMTRSLDGHAAATLTNGAIDGLDLWSAINGAVALAQKHSLPTGQVGKSTRFDAFKASADLANGVATTKDLDIASGDLRVTGQGTTNLVTGAVDYRVSAAILKGPSAGALASIPLLISGTMTNPSVRPDTQALVKSLAQQQLQKHKGEIESKLKGVLKGLIH